MSYVRSLAYVATGVPVGVATLAGLLLMITVGLPTVVLPAGIPILLAYPVGQLERQRVRLVDSRRLKAPHRMARRLHHRYRDPATWRDTGYTLMLAVSLWVIDLAVLVATVALPASLLLTPLLQALNGEAKLAKAVLVTSPAGAWAGFLLGAVWLAGSWWILPPYARRRAAIARGLLAADGVSWVNRTRFRLVEGFINDRLQIERALHDGAQQRLVALGMTLGIAKLADPVEVPALIDQAHKQAQLALEELQELIRGLNPRVLNDRGLAAAIAEVADSCPVPIELDINLPEERPSIPVETSVYFVVREAIGNIVKHSGATEARVTVRIKDGWLSAKIVDNGIGGASSDNGSGLTGLADRLDALGGRLRLSSPVGGPTSLQAEVPCA
jgi:signal transduction histidine kinase